MAAELQAALTPIGGWVGRHEDAARSSDSPQSWEELWRSPDPSNVRVVPFLFGCDTVAKESGMDIRSARDIAPVIEHAGTVPVWWLVEPGELHNATRGGFLELVSEWEVAGGGLVDPHSHPTHEFYYIISGRGVMKIADEEREVGQGDLIRIPPDTVHSIWPVTPNAALRGLAFAIGMEGSGPVDYTS
jgi:mannose-6-phosphate isomerase-like protein (cupin superfamily)